MKTTMMFRPMANPRRTTLAHLTDSETGAETSPQAAPTGAEPWQEPLPANTANPRRTTVVDEPTA